jgi:hypothetical protein
LTFLQSLITIRSMSYLSSAIRTRIEQQIATKTAQLDAANTAYTAALANSEIQTFTLDTGEGKQSSTRRNPKQLLEVIRLLESDLDRLYRRLNGGGIVNMNLRRRGWAY